MSASILIARLIGPILLVAAIAMLANVKDMQKMAHEFLENRALIFFSGFLTMLAGLAIANNHNVWIMEWPVIITLFGWAMIIGGTIRIAFPSVVRSIGNAMMENPTLIRVAGTAWAIVGAFLFYKGYFWAP